MRQELLESNRDLFQGLVFGSVHGLPLDDIQLEHLMHQRGRTDSEHLKYGVHDSAEGAQAGEEEMNSRNRQLRHKATLRLQEELNVERHQAELDEAAERLSSKYNDVLEQTGARRFHSKVSTDASPTPDVGTATFGMDDSMPLSPMTAGIASTSMPLSPGLRSRGSLRQPARTKAAEQAEEKRRRKELQEQVRQFIVKGNLPAALKKTEFNTLWVSPTTERLAHGQPLNSGSAESMTLKMKDGTDAFVSLPPIKNSHSQTKLDETKNLIDDVPESHSLPRMTVIQTNLLAPKKEEAKFPLWLEPPKRIGDRRIMGRFDMHLKSFLKKSFVNEQNAVDTTTGKKKQRTDPEQLRSQEKTYVRELEGLVGGHGSKALKLPTFTLNRSESSP